MGKEYENLINNYLVPNPNTESFGKLSPSSRNKLNRILHHLQPFERPDMYAKIENKVYILEHFSFDASHESKGGMEGLAEESKIERKIRKQKPDGQFQYYISEYSKTASDYHANFEKHFKSHYKRIGEYKNQLRKEAILSENDTVAVIFWAENLYPPFCISLSDRSKRGYLEYQYTKQFANLFKESIDVDFMLFGHISNGKRQLFYIDRETLLPDEKQIDLFDKDIHLLNTIECTIATTF